MRVLFINSLGKKKWGGGEKWMLMAATGLKERGHEVFIACKCGSIIQNNAHGANLKTLPLSFNSDFDIIGFCKLIHYLKKHRIEILICGQNKDTKIGSVAAAYLGNIVVLARHGLQLISKKNKYKFVFTKLIHGIITNTYSIKSEYDSYNWFDKNFVKVIYNSFIPPNDIPSIDLHYQLGIDKSASLIFSAGRLARQKGFEIFIEAASIAKKEGFNCCFLIAGRGKLEKKLKKMADNLGLKRHLFFLGFIDDVLPYMKASDLVVSSSYYEGMPNSLIEAMGIGKCCIATSVNGNVELINDGYDGYLIPPGEPIELFKAIKKLLADDNLREQMEQNAAFKIHSEFSYKNMVDELEVYLKDKKEFLIRKS